MAEILWQVKTEVRNLKNQFNKDWNVLFNTTRKDEKEARKLVKEKLDFFRQTQANQTDGLVNYEKQDGTEFKVTLRKLEMVSEEVFHG